MRQLAPLLLLALLPGCRDRVEPSAGIDHIDQRPTPPKLAAAPAPAALDEDPMAALYAAEARGATDCEKGFNVALLTAQALASDTPPPPLPERTNFLVTCDTLPVAVQRCLVPSFSKSHRAACEEVVRTLDDPTRAKLAAL